MKSCYRCKKVHLDQLQEIYGYTICNECFLKLRLLQTPTIIKHAKNRVGIQKKDPLKLSFQEEVEEKLEKLEKDYISKRIKLLHILGKLVEKT